MDIIIDKENNARTVKQYLFGVMGLSRAQVTHLKNIDDGIRLNGAHVTVRQVLAEGDVLSLCLDDRAEEVNSEILPVKMELEIVYEDDFILVVNKEGNMPVHPSHNHHDDTLANGMAYYFKEKGIPFNFRAVNRLDRDTSGLVIVAKSRRGANIFAKLIESRKIKKGYVAILEGTLPEKSARITTYIKREQDSIITRCNCAEGEGGDIAITDYEVQGESQGYTVVKAYPITGRTHQLRVHFSGLGCPLLGDSLYGRASSEIPRHALHAEVLEFCHPVSGETVCIRAPIPEDMIRIIKEKIKIEL